jgi:hypothetical protein
LEDWEIDEKEEEEEDKKRTEDQTLFRYTHRGKPEFIGAYSSRIGNPADSSRIGNPAGSGIVGIGINPEVSLPGVLYPETREEHFHSILNSS